MEPVRVADREGQLDIDTTGVCELLWSNHHAWMSSKVLSYQLQLAPKVNTQMRKFRAAVISAADDYRVLAAADARAEPVADCSPWWEELRLELPDGVPARAFLRFAVYEWQRAGRARGGGSSPPRGSGLRRHLAAAACGPRRRRVHATVCAGV